MIQNRGENVYFREKIINYFEKQKKMSGRPLKRYEI